MKNLFTKGNRKLPKTTLIFSLPAEKTCPGATPLCRKTCYAKKAERAYPPCLPSRTENWALTETLAFVEMASAQIAATNQPAIRIHESGDFYGQFYLELWFLIARRFPNRTFYAYTKSFRFGDIDADFTNKPQNFRLIASFDSTTPLRDIHAYERQSHAFSGTFTMIPKNQPQSCRGDCTICNVCWTRTNFKIRARIH